MVMLALSACAGAYQPTRVSFSPKPVEADESLVYYTVSQLRMHKNDLAGARQALDRALALDEGSVVLRLQSARLHLAIGERDQAWRILRQAMQLEANNAEIRLEAAGLAIEYKDYDLARVFINEALSIDPKQEDAWVFLGNLEASAKNYVAAIKAYDKALAINPDQEDVLLCVGIAYLENKQPKNAIKPLENLVQRQPSNLTIACVYLARAYIAVKNYSAAEKSYLQILEAEPDFPPALLELASLYEIQNLNRKAEQTYLRILEKNPDSPLARERLGKLYMRENNSQAALQQFAILKGIDPEDNEARISFGLSLFDQKHFDLALEEFRDILKQDSGNRRAWFYQAMILKDQGRYQEALDAFSRITPGEDMIYEDSALHQADIFLQQKNMEAAQLVLGQAIARRPQSVELYLGMATLKEFNRDFAEAFIILRQAARLEPDNADIYFRMGIVVDKQDNRPEAITFMRRAIELNPLHARALNYVGYSLLEEDEPNLEEAESLIRRAFNEEPDSYFILDSMGWVLYLQGRYQDSYFYLSRAAADKQAMDPIVFEHLGDVCVKLERWHEAQMAYNRAIELESENAGPIKDKLSQLPDVR